MKALFLTASLFVVNASKSTAQVGIGTTTPSANAILDITSPNKGLLLPRVNDTTTVSNPSAGLMIYNKNTQAPAYHNGTRWSTLATKTTGTTGTTGNTGTTGTTGASGRQDSVTYTLTGAGSPYSNGTFGTISAISSGNSNTYNPAPGSGGGSGKVTFENILISKAPDANSVAFVRAVSNGAQNSINTTMEFKVFAPGASTPYYSIKISAPHLIAYNVSLTARGQLVEQVTLAATIYGYKNWVTGQSFAWNIQSNTTATY